MMTSKIVPWRARTMMSGHKNYVRPSITGLSRIVPANILDDQGKNLYLKAH
jgi:hypothetical protein